MAAMNGADGPGNEKEKDESLNVSVKDDAMGVSPVSQAQEDTEMKAKVEAMWEQMNKGISNKALRRFSGKVSSSVNKTTPKMSNNWIKYLQMRPPKTLESTGQGVQANALFDMQNGTSEGAKKVDSQSEQMEKAHASMKEGSDKGPSVTQNGISDEAKRLAAAALSAVKDAAAAAASRGKIEITEVRDFAGQEIEIKKRIDAEAKEASEKAKASAPSAVDAVLEQIKKKPKLSVLDKTKMDWGEFKEENKGLEDELDAYKKSSNQYLDKVSFLQRADYREFERERDARLAIQARRRPDMREEP